MKALNAVALLALSIAACSENPVTPEEHFEAQGVIIRIADSAVATGDLNVVTGYIALDSGQTRSFVIKFIGDDGAIATPDHDHSSSASEFGLSIEVADTTVAVATATDEHAWTMSLAGRRGDTTGVRIHLLHGGHDDFVSLSIPIRVNL